MVVQRLHVLEVSGGERRGAELKTAGDLVEDVVVWSAGPARHGITRGTTIYFFDPSGNRNEVFSGGYLTGPDFPTITWTAAMWDRAGL